VTVRGLDGVTEVWPVVAEEVHPDHPGIRRAARVLWDGGLVAFPTETVYALGGLARLSEALAQIYAVKGRSREKPLSLLVRDREMAEALVYFSATAERLWGSFSPGPLTLILPIRSGVRLAATRGLRSVAVRSPDHPVARALIQTVGEPIAAPSANLSTRPSPTRAGDVLRDFMGTIPFLLDGGETPLGFESTIVDLVGEKPRLVREGAVPVEAITEVLGLPVCSAEGSLPADRQSPGNPSFLAMQVPFLVWEASPPSDRHHFVTLLAQGLARLERAGQIRSFEGEEEPAPRLAILSPEGYQIPQIDALPYSVVPFFLPRGTSGMRQFYQVLRALEAAEVAAVFVFLPPGAVLRPLRERLLATAYEVYGGPEEGGGVP